MAVTSIRELCRTESADAILTAFCAFGVLTSGLLAERSWVLPRGSALLLLAGVGATATRVQLLMTAAYRYCSVALGGLLSLVTVILAALVGFLFFGEPITFRGCWVLP